MSRELGETDLDYTSRKSTPTIPKSGSSEKPSLLSAAATDAKSQGYIFTYITTVAALLPKPHSCCYTPAT